MGGRGSIVAPLIGCVILSTLLNERAFYQLLAKGIIIIVAMLFDKATSGKQGGGPESRPDDVRRPIETKTLRGCHERTGRSSRRKPAL